MKQPYCVLWMILLAVLAGCGGGGSKAAVAVSAAATSPAGIVVSPGNTEATISWSDVEGATSYNLYWSTTAGVTPAAGTKVAGVKSPYTVTGLNNDTAYYFVVTALKGTSESAASTQVSATPALIPVPAGVSAEAGNGKVTISWAPVSGATSYNIYRSTSPGVNISTATKLPSVSNPYTQTGLTNGTRYYYVVTAVKVGNESEPSSEVSAQPSDGPPSAPVGLTATPGDGKVTLAWTTVDGASSYNIYRVDSAATTSKSTTDSYTDTGLANGTTYFYSVAAVNGQGESARSATVSARPATAPAPGMPTNLTAVPGNAQIAFTWDSVSGATSYQLYLSVLKDDKVTASSVETSSTNSFTKTGLTNGTTYFCAVTALNANGESTLSTTVSAKPKAP